MSVEGNNTPSSRPRLLWLCSHKLSTVTMFYYVFFLPAWLLGTELWCWKSMCQGVSVEGNKTPSFKPRLLGYVLTGFQQFYCFFLPARLHGTELWCWKSTCQGKSVESYNTLSSKAWLLWLCSHKLSTSHHVLQCFLRWHGSMGLNCDAGNPRDRARV